MVCKKTEQKLLQQQWMTFGNARLINDNKVSVFILVHNKEGVHYCDKIICQSQIVSVWEELKIKLKIKPITDVRKDLMNMEPSKGHVPNKLITEANGTVMVTNIYRTSKFFFFFHFKLLTCDHNLVTCNHKFMNIKNFLSDDTQHLFKNANCWENF